LILFLYLSQKAKFKEPLAKAYTYALPVIQPTVSKYQWEFTAINSSRENCRMDLIIPDASKLIYLETYTRDRMNGKVTG